jgi:hypothetical protein
MRAANFVQQSSSQGLAQCKTKPVPRVKAPISTYTQQDGPFELYNIPKGYYEVVAESADYKEARYELQASIVRERHGQMADQAKQMLAQLDALEVPEVEKQR